MNARSPAAPDLFSARRATVPVRRRRSRGRRGFSIVEMLMALTISATLLTSLLVAMDAFFRSYTVSSESASTHVIARSVVHRIMTMVRTGAEFGPAPTDVTDPAQNPAQRSSLEFIRRNADGSSETTRVVVRAAGTIASPGGAIQLRGPNVLWLEIDRVAVGGARTTTRQPLLDGVLECNFETLYDVGPRLRVATIDLTVRPQGNSYATWNSATGMWEVQRIDEATGRIIDTRMVASTDVTPVIRLVSSAGPRGLD